MLLFDEDSEGNVIELAPEPAYEKSPMADVKTPEKQESAEVAEPIAKPKVDDETGKLANVPITSFYGSQLNDQQRVDRFNDLRAF